MKTPFGAFARLGKTCVATLAVLLGAAVLTACTSPMVRSTPAADGQQGGVAYYLPKRLAKVALERQMPPTEQQVKEAKEEFDTAKKALEAGKKETKAAQELLDAIPSGPDTADARAKQTTVLQLAKAKEALLKKPFDDANAAYQVAKAAHEKAKQGEISYLDKFALAVQPPIADTSKRFVAQFEHSSSRNDKGNIKTTTAGLLSGVAATAEDKTGDIIAQIAGFISAIAGAPAGAVPAKVIEGAKPSLPRCGPQGPFSIDFLIDPMSLKAGALSLPNDWDQTKRFDPEQSSLERLLCDAGAEYYIRRTNTIVNPSPKDNTHTEVAVASCDVRGGVVAEPRSCGAGLFYRRDLPYVVTVYRRKDNANFAPVTQFMISVPNDSPTEFVSMVASTFVTTTFTTTFDNGLLVEHAQDNPSETLAIAKLPIDVLSAIFSIPADLFTLRIKYLGKEKEFADAQKSLKEALDALNKAQQGSSTSAAQ